MNYAAKLASNPALRRYVQERLSGKIFSVNGRAIQGPQVIWKGRRHGPRQHRRWARAWSPVCYARYSDQSSSRNRVGSRNTGSLEGDLILGLVKSAIGTLVERATRYTVLLHLPPMPEHGLRPRQKHGPALAGHGATAVRDAITRTMACFPQQLRQSLTWDQGTEMAQHLRLRIDTGVQVYFCDPQSPWQGGTNENTNGLLRQYFPKGTDLSRYSPGDLEAVALALNTRPRKTLGWLTPAEALKQVLQTTH